MRALARVLPRVADNLRLSIRSGAAMPMAAAAEVTRTLEVQSEEHLVDLGTDRVLACITYAACGPQDMRFDNTFVRELPGDKETSNSLRQVSSTQQ